MCVGVMAMVDAVCGGVLYSVNPMDIRDQSVTINAVWGLPTAVVDGATASGPFSGGQVSCPGVDRPDLPSKKKNMSAIRKKGCVVKMTPGPAGPGLA
jgi:pyruvate,water dikinase